MLVMFEKSTSTDKVYIDSRHVLYVRAWVQPETTLITLATVSPSISYEFCVKGDVAAVVKALNSAI
jgi:hypothetical protein